MSEYVSKENFEQYDSKLKEYIDETLQDNLDLLSYGVSWTTEQSDPHLTRVGNMTYHKTLPIQNNMKGCIAQMKDGPKIMYYLHPDNWGRRKDPIILKNKQINYNEVKLSGLQQMMYLVLTSIETVIFIFQDMNLILIQQIQKLKRQK